MEDPNYKTVYGNETFMFLITLSANAKILIQNNHDSFLSLPYQFIIYLLTVTFI